MTKAIRIHETGGPEVLKWEDIEVGEPGPGEARVRHSAVGLNYIDVYGRTGIYPMPSFPQILGMEAAGIVDAIGQDVSEVAVGDRVAYVCSTPGSYAEERVVPAERLIKLPDAISEDTAAAMMLKGLTAQYLLRRTYEVRAGDTILIHAAAGGVGQIVCQWAKHLGATVIGTVGSDEKAEQARAHGCDHPIVYSRENFKDRVAEITNGEGVNVVYDSVGKDTFTDSLDCLMPLGMMVTFGNSSGPVDDFQPSVLGKKGSLFLTRPTLFTYIARHDDLQAMAADLFDVVSSGVVKIEINQTYELKDTAQAHADLEGRKTTGSTILKP